MKRLAAQAPNGRSCATIFLEHHQRCALVERSCAKWSGWTTLVLRQFRTFLAKQGRSSLLFMLKSNKNLEPVE
nr:hypothetical protein [uncultured Anaerotignum sp.]